MTALEALVERIDKKNKDNPSLGTEGLRWLIQGHVADVLNLYKNIMETSLQTDDRDQRIEEMCGRYGIEKVGEKFY
jgi:hypothetical protein